MRTKTIMPATLLLTLLSGCTAYGAQGYSSAPIYGAPSYRAGYEIQSVEQFYQPLARYGQWVQTRWGLAFAPSVDRGWRPYTIGHWSDFGGERQWESDEPWGWATYHYGRWGYEDRIGWVWVPDTNWGPAWVAWRDGGDYAGWAPIPPGIRFSLNLGYSDWDYDRWYRPSWVFVSRHNLYRPGFGGSILPWQRGRDYWGSTRYSSHPHPGRHDADRHARDDGRRDAHRGGGQHAADQNPGNHNAGGPGQWRYNDRNRQPNLADDRNARRLPSAGFDPRGRSDDPRRFEQNRAADPSQNARGNDARGNDARGNDARSNNDRGNNGRNGGEPGGRDGNAIPNNFVPNQNAVNRNADGAPARAQLERAPQLQPQPPQYQAPPPAPRPIARPNERAPEPE